MNFMNSIFELETPCLLLDLNRLERNIARFAAIATQHEVNLRPHLKTLKSTEAALLTVGKDGPITVSTLAEAEYFSAAGFRDIVYAVGIAPGKLSRAKRLVSSGVDLKLLTDSTAVARAASGLGMKFLLEVDCGDERGGLPMDSPHLLAVAKEISEGGNIVEGVLTHAGHSYSTNDLSEVKKIAEEERRSAVGAAALLRSAGYPAPIVSIGSTPTVAFGENFDGVTELRAGVFMPFDLDQMSRGVCASDDLALSVLTTVIGHNREAGRILVDAGGLALSKDISASGFLVGAGYGHVVDAKSAISLGLVIDGVSQEHGKINLTDPTWFERLPVGSQVRVFPNHACFTAAAYPGYHLIKNGDLAGQWNRVNGW